MPFTEFDHYTIFARDMDVSANFYQEIMGFRTHIQEGFEVPFRIMFLEDEAILHLMGVGAPPDVFHGRSATSSNTDLGCNTGKIQHVAFKATGLAVFLTKLRAAGIPFVERSVPDKGVTVLAFNDPDGVEIEVNFSIKRNNLKLLLNYG